MKSQIDLRAARLPNAEPVPDLVEARLPTYFKVSSVPGQNGFVPDPFDVAPRRLRQPRIRHKRFAAGTAGEARTAASEWLRDFKTHGPLQIEKIATREYEDQFLTVVTYSRSGSAGRTGHLSQPRDRRVRDSIRAANLG